MRDLIRLLSFLLRFSREIPRSRATIALIVFAGIVSGVASTGMIALINSVVAGGRQATSVTIGAFVGLCVALPLFRVLSQVLLIALTQSSLQSLRLQLSRRVLAAPLRQLESLGAHRLLAILTTDIQTIIEAFAMVPLIIMHMAVLASCLLYLGWLSWHVLLETFVLMLVGVVTFQLAMVRAFAYLRRSRELLNDIMRQVRALIEGTKELKMHRARRQAFLGTVEASARDLLQNNRRGSQVFAFASSWGQVLFYVLIGCLVFLLPRYQTLATETLIGYTIVIFQMMTPLEVIFNTLPGLSRAAVASRVVEQVGFSLNDETPGSAVERLPAATAGESWALLELSGVLHRYQRENEDESFLLGPIDLTFQRGEIVLLVGGNGSGKTTLAKLLIGLYAPESGEIRWQRQAVTAENREEYRESFSVVFSDFFVFEKLFGLDAAALDDEARHYLRRLRLEQKVRVEGGNLSTVDLSQGQRKRLALLTAYLENRPVYLFDEWAADQDPTFKEVFYRELLPELKHQGKTVFVISHDDQYFHVADRIIKLVDGKVESDLRPARPAEPHTDSRYADAREGSR